jgi:hypothetical protein
MLYTVTAVFLYQCRDDKRWCDVQFQTQHLSEICQWFMNCCQIKYLKFLALHMEDITLNYALLTDPFHLRLQLHQRLQTSACNKGFLAY